MIKLIKFKLYLYYKIIKLKKNFLIKLINNKFIYKNMIKIDNKKRLKNNDKCQF